jgi:hypothetical protein
VVRPVIDEEVKTARHDEVLNWLVDSLEDVIDAVFSRAPDWLEREATAQRALGLGKIDDVCRRLEAIAAGRVDEMSGLSSSRKHSAAVMDAARSKAAEFRRWMMKPAWPAPQTTIGKATVVRWEIMKPVLDVVPTPLSNRPGHARDAGFVDLCVTFSSTDKLSLNGIPEFHRYSLRDSGEDIDIVTGLTMGPLNWSAIQRDRDLWISVRTGSFTLGEVLQELKTLRQLGESEHLVALCVDAIAPEMAAKILHERIHVIDKSAFGVM